MPKVKISANAVKTTTAVTAGCGVVCAFLYFMANLHVTLYFQNSFDLIGFFLIVFLIVIIETIIICLILFIFMKSKDPP
jgi:hypothetical protein